MMTKTRQIEVHRRGWLEMKIVIGECPAESADSELGGTLKALYQVHILTYYRPNLVL